MMLVHRRVAVEGAGISNSRVDDSRAQGSKETEFQLMFLAPGRDLFFTQVCQHTHRECPTGNLKLCRHLFRLMLPAAKR